ncbi:MFS transporter [Subtercola boreus]|nr:MFS transporter [Subtercola boreus]TQL55551.1 putative MFS family arabinose efflux permease [Subtercola boreus]
MHRQKSRGQEPGFIVPAGQASTASRRALVSGTLGSALEWFDFAIYGAVSATVFPALFFVSLDPATAIIASFATFGVGFVARPIGGIFFGYIGDRHGRRITLLITFMTMGAATVVIGLLPTYDQVGLLAPLLLVLMRFIQGFALGGEATGSQLLTMEHAPADRRAFFGSLMGAGSPISQVLANTLLLVLTLTLSTADFTSWGWRIPFFLSVLFVIIGLYIRFRVDETPIYKEKVLDQQIKNPSTWTVLRTKGWTILALIFAYSPIAITFYLVTVFGITYMTKTVGFSTSETFSIVLIANLLSIGAIVLGGRAADHFGRKNILFTGGAGCLLAAVLFFPLINLHSYALALIIVSFACISAQFGNGSQAALYAELFPTQMRYSGSALALTGVNLIFSAPAPLAAAFIIASLGGVVSLTLIWMGFIVIALVVMARMKDGPSLEGVPQTFPLRGNRALKVAENASVG